MDCYYRLHPVGFFASRIIEKDMFIRGHVIPAKVNKNASILLRRFILEKEKNIFTNLVAIK